MEKQNVSCHKTQAFNLLCSDVYPLPINLMCLSNYEHSLDFS